MTARTVCQLHSGQKLKKLPDPPKHRSIWLDLSSRSCECVDMPVSVFWGQMFSSRLRASVLSQNSNSGKSEKKMWCVCATNLKTHVNYMISTPLWHTITPAR